MSPHPRQRLGAAGEDRAQAWYLARGYELVARNWRCREGELDLIVARPGLLVICEVKTRSSVRFGLPAEAVTPDKQRRVRSLARAFLTERELRPRQLRFDVAAVLGAKVEVIESAF